MPELFDLIAVAVIFGSIVIWLLKRRPKSAAARTAFIWIGPRPIAGESLARYHLRWARFSFGCFIAFSLTLCIYLFVESREPSLVDPSWMAIPRAVLGILGIPSVFGAPMAAIATVGFAAKAGIARLLGR